MRYFRHTGHSQQVMLTVSASSPDLADVHCLESIHIVSVISMWLWSAFIKGSVILCWLCVFIVLLYLLLENFQVKYFVPIKLHHLPLSPGCVRSCIFYSLLRVHNSFFSCYPLSFPLKKNHTIINGNGFLQLTCLLSKPLIFGVILPEAL